MTDNYPRIDKDTLSVIPMHWQELNEEDYNAWIRKPDAPPTIETLSPNR